MATLATYFSKSAVGGNSLRNLLGRKMKPGESLYNYYNDLLAFCDHSSIKEEVSRVAFFINGLEDNLANFVTAAKPKTIHEAYNIANSLHSRQPQPSVNAVAANSDQRPRPRSAGADRAGPAVVKSDMVCWTCGETNHLARFCPNRRSDRGRPRPNASGGQQRYMYGQEQQTYQNRYPQRPPNPGQSFPGPHNVQQPSTGANPYCTRCGVAHAFGSHTLPFNDGPRRQPPTQQRYDRNLN